MARGKKLVYVTRTNSQQRQVMRELREIGGKRRVMGIALQGRRNMCPLARTDPELRDGNPEELSKVCSERKARVMKGDEEACSFFAETMARDLKDLTKYVRSEFPTAEEFGQHCTDRGLCPYEVAKILVPAADVVAAPYVMFFEGFIRHNLLDWMGCTLPDLVLVVDEAHNLPSYARELRSARLTNVGLRLADSEIDEFGDPEVADGMTLRDLVSELRGALERAIEEYLLDEDGIIPQTLLEEELMFRTGMTSVRLKGVLSQAMNYGEMVRDRKRLSGRLPRSFVHRMASFLTFWQGLEEGEYVKLVVRTDVDAFEAYCLDASIACRPVMECHASVHMSGTLRPLDDYALSIGLPSDAVKEVVGSPFPPENRRVLFVDDVTTRYEDLERDPDVTSRIAGHISAIASGSPRNTIVFYPSYATMDRITGQLDGSMAGRPVFFEQRGMRQDELMETVGSFKAADGALLHAISGGRVSEGIDFPGQELELALVAGIPYPKPTARQRALQYFCDIRFGDGWDHAVKAPTTRKLLQAIGRLIRSETDRGVAVILDRRAVHFTDALCAVRSSDPATDVREFFGEQGRTASPPDGT